MSAPWHHDDGPVPGDRPGQVATVGALEGDLLEAEGAPLGEPHLDRGPDDHRAAHELALVERRLEDALALEQRDVEERLTVDPEQVRRDERGRLVARRRRARLVGLLERLA